MSQPIFARLLGMDKSAVAQWERDAKRAAAMCCTYQYLDMHQVINQ
jgi:DNA-binding transcriptional regulator YiaG